MGPARKPFLSAAVAGPGFEPGTRGYEPRKLPGCSNPLCLTYSVTVGPPGVEPRSRRLKGESLPVELWTQCCFHLHGIEPLLQLQGRRATVTLSIIRDRDRGYSKRSPCLELNQVLRPTSGRRSSLSYRGVRWGGEDSIPPTGGLLGRCSVLSYLPVCSQHVLCTTKVPHCANRCSLS